MADQDIISLLTFADFNTGTIEAIASQGYNTFAKLMQLDESLMSKMAEHVTKIYQHADVPDDPSMKVTFPFRAVKTLKLVKHWYDQNNRLGRTVNPNNFNENERLATEMRIKEEDEIEEVRKNINPVKPSPLKDIKKWRTFWENWLTYIGQYRGAAKIPLTYIFRENEEPETKGDDEYDDKDSMLVAKTLLSGSYYVIDNKRVYDEFKTFIGTEGPGWPFIKAYNAKKDGRKAILTLKKQAEGTSVMMNRRDTAITVFRTVKYNGPRRNFSIDNYIEKYQFAINELTEIDGMPPTEGQLVSDFTAGITDPTLAVVKTLILSDDKYRGSFQATQQLIKTMVDSMANQSKMSREVSAVGKEDKRGKSGKKPAGQKSTDGKKAPGPFKGPVTLRSYTPAEWRSMSTDQRDKVKDLQAKSKEVKSVTSSEEQERAVDAVETTD